MKEEDIYYLSPLLHKHINFVGKYNFYSGETLNQLRDLNSSKDSQEKENIRF
ncbi:hypothetical protein FKZ16_14165 [Enterococcus faecalis]|nr:hypothetical protein FKZ16_14165 [Enterococcus faecalis]